MGPPFITAEWRTKRLHKRIAHLELQWGRRSSRRSGHSRQLHASRFDQASMGPPFITAEWLLVFGCL